MGFRSIIVLSCVVLAMLWKPSPFDLLVVLWVVRGSVAWGCFAGFPSVPRGISWVLMPSVEIGQAFVGVREVSPVSVDFCRTVIYLLSRNIRGVFVVFRGR